jgi:HEAT repeat protein
MKKLLLIILLFSGVSVKAQQEITALGQAGLTALASKLKPGDNTRLQYTLGNYACYVTQANQEDNRKVAARAFGAALAKVPDLESKAFLISLLQICGDSKSVPILKLYLPNKRLCDPATRALIQINSPNAKVALLTALKNAGNKVAVISALGQLRYLGASDELTVLTNSKNPVIKRNALMALANVADANSEPLLAAAAAKSHYSMDSTDATAAYLLYTQRLTQNWPVGPAIASADKLLKNSKDVHIRSAALKMLTDVRSNEATMILMNAADDKDPEFRAAALMIANRTMTSDKAVLWIRKAETSKGVVKAGVITLLGNSQQTAALKIIKSSLSDKEGIVQLAAIQAAGAIGSREMVPSMLNVMKTADTTSVLAIRDVLLTIRGMDVVPGINASMPFQPPFAQAALKEVLAIRQPGK